MRPLLVLSLASALVACKSKEETPMAAKPAEPPSVPETTKLQPGTTASGIDMSKLGGQLKKEAENRPKGVITVEQVFESLGKVDLKVERTKQIVALTAAASYCANGRVDNIVVVVCEYPTAAEAETGLQAMVKKWGTMAPNALRKLNGATMLTVVTGNPADADRVSKIVSTFAALSPRSNSSGS